MKKIWNITWTVPFSKPNMRGKARAGGKRLPALFFHVWHMQSHARFHTPPPCADAAHQKLGGLPGKRVKPARADGLEDAPRERGVSVPRFRISEIPVSSYLPTLKKERQGTQRIQPPRSRRNSPRARRKKRQAALFAARLPACLSPSGNQTL